MHLVLGWKRFFSTRPDTQSNACRHCYALNMSSAVYEQLAALDERIAREAFLSPPEHGLLAGMDPKQYTMMVRDAVRRTVEKMEHFESMQSLATTASMTRAFSRLASLAENAGSIGVANIAMAMLVVAYMTLPSSLARAELQSFVLGSDELDAIADKLLDPCRSVMLMTFDSKDHNDSCNGCTTQTPTATLIKEHIVKTFSGQAIVVNRASPDESAVAEINSFCNEKTKGKIPKILDDLDSATKAVILAAEYIAVEWQIALDMDEPTTFNGVDGAIAYQDFACYNNMNVLVFHDPSNGCVAVKVDTKSQPSMAQRSMVFILPPEGIEDAKKAYFDTASALRADAFQEEKVEKFSIPVVDIAVNKVDGKELLRRAGVSEIFDSLDAMAPFFMDHSGLGGVKVERIIHMSCIKWNRFGAEAAAATLVECVYRSLCVKPMYVFDRPFLALLGYEAADGAYIPEFFAEITGKGGVPLGHHQRVVALRQCKKKNANSFFFNAY